LQPGIDVSHAPTRRWRQPGAASRPHSRPQPAESRAPAPRSLAACQGLCHAEATGRVQGAGRRRCGCSNRAAP
jgi:hypothetical protein